MLRQGRPIYGLGNSNSPNYKGATAVRPNEALKGTIVKRITPVKPEPKILKRAAGRRLGK
jgi:hypothetical protein